MAPKPETRLANRIKKLVKDTGGVVLKIHGTGMQETGHPDLFGWVALEGREPLHFAIELKVGNNITSPMQDHRLKEWGRGGFVVGVVTSVDEFVGLIRDQYQN